MKRSLIRFELLLFNRCYCASNRPDPVQDSLDDLRGFTWPTISKKRAMRKAARRERRTGEPWHVSKWGGGT